MAGSPKTKKPAPAKSGAKPASAKPKAPAKPVAKTSKPSSAAHAKAGAKPAVASSAKKPEAKPVSKVPAKGAGAKPAPGKAPPAKPATASSKGGPSAKPATAPQAKAPAKGAPAPVPAAGSHAGAAAAGKKSPKGITIVNPKQIRKSKPKVKLEMPRTEPLIKPGQKWKPLIQSGPKAPPSPHGTWRAGGPDSESEFKIDPKARLGKKDLDKYREVLVRKRAELLGDINTMEEEALRTNSGSLSSLPQHMAEQGSDTFDQSVSLDLAAVDRNLLREIDAALSRIEKGTYGVCMKTGRRISAERLAELPWAQYSIEAAREMERRPIAATSSSSSSSSAASSADND